MCVSTFVPIGQQDAGHELLLAVVPEGVADHDLLLRQLPIQLQCVAPVKHWLGWRRDMLNTTVTQTTSTFTQTTFM